MKKIKILRITAIAVLVFNLFMFVLPESKTKAADSEYYTYVILEDGTVKITECSSEISGDITIPTILSGKVVTAIADYAFDSCYQLTGVTIPAGITKIGANPFRYCSNLTQINVNVNNLFFTSEDNVLFNKTKTSLISCPRKKTGEYTIPDTVNIIDSWAFAHCSDLTGINIPEGVISIGEETFRRCDKLTAVIIPNSVNIIETGAFYYCLTLKNVTIGNGLTILGDRIFQNCYQLTDVNLGNSITSIGDYAFLECRLLAGITIPDSVKTIGTSAFQGCIELSGLNMGTGVTSIGQYAFFNCVKLKTLILPDSLIIINSEAFNNCTGLINITFGSHLTTIDDYAFISCTALTNLTIPESVTLIGSSAFANCEGLANILFINPDIVFERNAFGNYGNDLVFYCPDGSTAEAFAIQNNIRYHNLERPISSIAINALPAKTTYLIYEPLDLTGGSITVTYDDHGTDIIALTDSMVSGYDANKLGTQTLTVTYYGKTATFDVTVSIYRIVNGVLTNYMGTDKAVVLPDGITGIGDSVFKNKTNILSIEIPAGVTSIGGSAFEGCTKLSIINLPDGLTSIGSNAFYNCTKLSSLSIPGSVTAVGANAFENTPWLQNETDKFVVVGNHLLLKYRGTDSFVMLPDDLISIADAAFAAHPITEIAIPDSVVHIGDNAFDNCPNVRIFGKKGSFAETYCVSQHLPCTTDIVAVYSANVQNIGWQAPVVNGELCGISGQSLKVEALKINLINAPDGMKIKYRVHVPFIGWMSWMSDGAMAGTAWIGLRVEAIQIKLEGTDADKYSVEYQSHVQNIGWQNWVHDGATSGTEELPYRVEAVKIKITDKIDLEPASNDSDDSSDSNMPNVVYQGHVQNIGWMDPVANGEISGTSGMSLRAEAFKIQLADAPDGLKIKYKGHVQNIGWMDWVYGGNLCGTAGQSLRLEALQIELEGADADKYSVEYQVHVQNIGWMNWVKDGAAAGTTGQSLRIEAVRIRIVPKVEQ